MSDNRSHINKVVSEALIRQYLAGELDDKAMHQLEKQALDDPFLAEALEGYAEHPADQRAALSDLEGRLSQRIQQPARQGKVRPLYYRWAAAAVILLLMGISTIWLFKQQAPSRTEIVMQEVLSADTARVSEDSSVQDQVPAPAVASTMPSQDALAKDAVRKPVRPKPKAPPVISQKQAVTYAAPVPVMAMESSTSADSAADVAGKRQLALDEVNVIGYSVPKNNASTGNAAAVTTITNLEKNAPPAPALMGKMAGARSSKQHAAGKRLLSGTVTDNEQQRPIPGAVVRIAGTSGGTVTDEHGRFALPVDSNRQVTLDFFAIGFEKVRQLVAVKENDLTIAMKVSTESLNEEVVVAGRGRSHADEDEGYYGSPRPADGYAAFKQYLKTHVSIPAGESKGNGRRVKVSFVVTSSGSLEDFKIRKSAGAAFDEAAIRVIKEGPSWRPATDGKATRVNVTVRFPDR